LKTATVTALFALVLLPLTASAASKICFGSTISENTKGAVVSIEFNQAQIVIKTLKGGGGETPENGYNGTYPAYGTQTKAFSGKIYIEYKGEDVDQQDVIMVDSELFKTGTTGLLQIRSRGEGYFNSVYVCKDAK
jgi:hypothetical protein